MSTLSGALVSVPGRSLRAVLVYSSAWVAAGIASLVILVQHTMGLDYDRQPVLLVFFFALAFYNLDRIADSYLQPSLDSQAQAFFRHGWGWLILVAATVAVAVLLMQSNRTVLLLSLVGIVPLAYGLPVIPWRRSKRLVWRRLKDIPGSKAWVVSGMAAYALVTLPLAYAGAPIGPSAIPTFLFLFLFLAVNVHLFDIRDIESDRRAGVVTLPVLIGVRGTRRACLAMVWLAWLLVGSAWIATIAAPPPEVVLPWLIATGLVLSLARPDTPRGWYDLRVDGSLFLPALMIGIAQTV